jgi:putative membrane protein
MKKIFLTNTALALAVFALTGCPGTATNTTNTTNSAVSNANVLNSNTAIVVNSNSNMTNSNMDMSSSMSDTTTPEGFMTEAAKGGMEEIELSKLALNKATNKEVRDFAQKMVTDHTKASGELKALAAKKKFTLPAVLTPEQVSMATDMAKVPSEEFDEEYVDAMVKDHEKDVSLFEAQSKTERMLTLKLLPPRLYRRYRCI